MGKLLTLPGVFIYVGLVLVGCTSALPTTTYVAPQVVQEATTAPTPTPPPLPVNLERLDISSQGNVIQVSLAGLQEAAADQVQSLPNVTKVEGYLIVATPDYPNPIIGMEPESALRVEDTIVTLAVGESFQSRDERVAIPGLNLNSNPYTSGDGMAETGQSRLKSSVRTSAHKARE